MSSINKETGINELELNELFLESNDYYIGLYNAFNLHHFTEQVPNKLFVFNTKIGLLARQLLGRKVMAVDVLSSMEDKLTGIAWELQQKAAVLDYLPKTAELSSSIKIFSN